MKKIFTAIAALALTATAANAAITVEYEGKQLANGEELVMNDEDFKYTYQSFPMGDGTDFEYHEWSCSVDLTVKGSAPIVASAVTDAEATQFCPVSCIPWKEENGVFTASGTYQMTELEVPIHYNIQDQILPALDNYMKCTFSDKDGDIVVNIKFKTEGSSGVNEIVAGSEKKVAAIYDLQGRRVREDYRGAAIVVYDNGEAVKRIVK